MQIRAWLKFVPNGDARRLDFTAEAFNMLNHPNVLGINPYDYSADFGVPSIFANRQMRFSIDFEF